MSHAKYATAQLHKDRPVTIAALGKTGKGKSATLNTLVQFANNQTSGPKIDCFESQCGPDSVSTEVSTREIQPIDFPKCFLIDTVGLFDTILTSEIKTESIDNVSHVDEKHKSVLAQFSQVMKLCKEGVDVFLFVLNATERASKEEFETIDVIFKYFGSKMMDHVIFVITHKQNENTTAFDGWRSHILNHLKEKSYPIEKIRDRFIFIDNRNSCDSEAEDLLSLIRDVKERNQNRPYNDRMFEMAQNKFDEEKKEMEKKAKQDNQEKLDKVVRKNEFRLKIKNMDMQLRIGTQNLNNREVLKEMRKTQRQNERAILEVEAVHEEEVQQLDQIRKTEIERIQVETQRQLQQQREQMNAIIGQLQTTLHNLRNQ